MNERELITGAPGARRPRRLRATAALRGLRREEHLRVDQLVQPLFFVEDPAQAGPIESMPGIARHALEDAPRVAERLMKNGVRAALIFGLPSAKDADGSSACDPDGV